MSATAVGRRIARAQAILGPYAEAGAPLAGFTTFRLGGPAALLVRADSAPVLVAVRAAVGATGLAVLVVGQGSNLLVADDGWPGIALVLCGSYAELEVEERRSGGERAGRAPVVRAGGAVKLPVLARRTAGEGLRGLEWAVGVPGSVGGAVRMNAGGHGADVAASLVDADVVSLSAPPGESLVERRPHVSLEFGYRHSAIGPSEVVVGAGFKVSRGDRGEAGALIDEIVRWRREHQPGGANCGSVFTNPAGDAAGRLIDSAGLKGHRVGTASISVKHANFVQADASGRAADVVALIQAVRQRVHDHHGVWLQTEVQLAGFPADVLEQIRETAIAPGEEGT